MTQRSIPRLLLAAAILLFGAVARSAPIEETLPGGIVANADFRPGEPGRPAVLVLHGFMTTHRFGTVQTLVGDLAAKGYTVLAPTLSLDIPDREETLPCDAIHTHRFGDDLAELDWWVDWLADRGHASIVLVGHSTGSLHELAYVANQPHPAVKLVVGTSLAYIEQLPAPGIEAKHRRAREKRAADDRSLDNYSLVFCRDNFRAPASVYLSYVRWDREHLLDQLSETRVPLEVIMAGNDQRFGQDWRDALADHGASIHVVEGANHFFDDMYEFELLDTLDRCLAKHGLD